MTARRNAPTLVIGIDGLGPRTLTRLGLAGRLPHLSRLIGLGQRFRILSTVPEDPVVLWADLATGTHGAYHGVLSAVKPSAEGLAGVTTDDWFVKPVWLAAADAGVPTAVINWPASSAPEDGLPASLRLISDLHIHEGAGAQASKRDRADRLCAQDIPPSLVSELFVGDAVELNAWPAEDPRRIVLAAALARAGTIQNAAVSALEDQRDLTGLLMVRYDLPAVLAELALPKPGVFDRLEEQAPDPARLAVVDGGVVLIDAMIGTLHQLMPRDTAVLIVGLLDYVLPDPAPDEPEPRVEHAEGLVFLTMPRRLHQCRRSGGFGLWHDPSSAIPSNQPAIKTDLHRLNGYIRSRYKLHTVPRPTPVDAPSLVGLDDTARRLDDRLSLRLTNDPPRHRAAWDAVILGRALNLARAASAHRRWRFAVHAWDLVLTREDTFNYHALRLQALLNSGRFEAFDQGLAWWLDRVPDQPVLRQLARVRSATAEPTPPKWPPQDRVTPYTQMCETQSPSDRPAAWTEVSEKVLQRLALECSGAVQACRSAYTTLERTWTGIAEQLCTHVGARHALRGHSAAIQRSARVLIAVNSFQGRHSSANENAIPIDDALAGLDARVDLLPYGMPWLLELHRALYANPDASAMIGRFRERALDTKIKFPRLDGRLRSSHPFPTPEDNLPELTRRMLAATRCLLDECRHDPLIIAAIAMVALTKIHPFSDGNGRTSRALLIHILRHHGFPLIDRIDLLQWFERQRERYLAHIFPIASATVRHLDDPPALFYLYVSWTVDLVRQACENAIASIARLIEADLFA